MYPFRRPFRLLELVFPGSGIGNREFPVGVDGTVIPIWDMAKPRTGDVLFDSRALVSNANAADFTLSSSANRPPAGKIRIITSAAAIHADAAARDIDFGVTQVTTVAAPPWGSWWALAGGSRVIGGVLAVPPNRFLTLGPFPLWFEDTDVFARFRGMTGGGEQVQFHFTFVELPGELIDVELR